jgi:hypothetical protein
MPRCSRHQRDLERARRAAMMARAQGATAMGVALAQIDAAFGRAAVVNAFKLRVEEFIRLGPHHPAVRARFSARIELLRGRSLDAAIVLAERWWRAEQKAFAIASALGRGSALSLETLRELRLILRLMRFKRMHDEFGAIVTAMLGVCPHPHWSNMPYDASPCSLSSPRESPASLAKQRGVLTVSK